MIIRTDAPGSLKRMRLTYKHLDLPEKTRKRFNAWTSALSAGLSIWGSYLGSREERNELRCLWVLLSEAKFNICLSTDLDRPDIKDPLFSLLVLDYIK